MTLKILHKMILVLFVYIIFSSIPQPVHAQIVPQPVDIIIDVGHGGIDGGTSSGKVLEKDINLAIGAKLYTLLQKQSYYVGITRLHDYALSDDSLFKHLSRHKRDLNQRKLIAETLKPKLFISLHVNWSKKQRVRGPIVIYQPNHASYTAAQFLQHHLNDLYGTKKKPMKGSPYYLMKTLKMPAVIVEMGYISNPQDLNMLLKEETQDQIVFKIAQAINDYLLLNPY